VDHDPQHAWVGLGDARWCGGAVVEFDTLAELSYATCRHRPARDLGQVLLFDTMRRVGDPIGQRAVVGE
jgi:hypothetical protein